MSLSGSNSLVCTETIESVVKEALKAAFEKISAMERRIVVLEAQEAQRRISTPYNNNVDCDDLTRHSVAATEPDEPVTQAQRSSPLRGDVFTKILNFEVNKINNEVCLAKDCFGNRFVVKLPRDSDNASNQHELMVLQHLHATPADPPNIVKLARNSLTIEGGLVLEYVEGGSLSNISRQHRNLKTALQVGLQLLDAMHCLHEGGIIHGDIKPGNVLWHVVNGELKIKLTDFASAVKSVMKPEDSRTFVVVSGRGCGTMQYCAPEAFLRLMTPACDIWSFACAIAEYLTGVPPQIRSNPRDVYDHLWIDDSVPIGVRNELLRCFAGVDVPDIPVEDFVRECLEVRPSVTDLQKVFKDTLRQLN